MPLSAFIFEHMIMSKKYIASHIENHVECFYLPTNKAQVPKTSIKGLP